MAGYAVTLKAYVTVWVDGVSDENEAIETAWQEANTGWFEIDEAEIDGLAKTAADCDRAI